MAHNLSEAFRQRCDVEHVPVPKVLLEYDAAAGIVRIEGWLSIAQLLLLAETLTALE